jgi:hypothetical protein
MDFEIFSSPSFLPPELSWIETCITRLQSYKKTKWYDLRKILRIGSRTIEVGVILEVLYLPASQLTSDRWKILRGPCSHI